MSAFNAYDTMMGTAKTSASIAAVPLPAVWPIIAMLGVSKGSPANLEKAAKEWDAVVEGIDGTVQEFRASVKGVPAQSWSADDRTAYEAKVEEYCAQLEILKIFCQAIAITLIVFAWALFIYAVFAIAMGVFLAALAAVFVVAAATVVGAGVAASCQSIAATCVPITAVATGVLAAAASIGAAVCGGGSAGAALGSGMNGNEQALGDFAEAFTVGSVSGLTNLAQNAINAGLEVAGARPGGGSSPIGAVDLDLDRNAEDTWTGGGGVTVNLPGGGNIRPEGHVQVNEEHGIVGGDVGVSGQTPGGFTYGGNVGYTDADGIGQGEAGTLNWTAKGGWTSPGSLSTPEGEPDVPLHTAGVEGQLSGTHNFESGQHDVTGTGKVNVNGGTVASHSETVGTGPDGTTWGSSTSTPVGTETTEKPPWDR